MTVSVAAPKHIYFGRRRGRRTVAAAVCLAASFITAGAQQDRTYAQARLDADYAITFARLPVGSFTLSVTYGADDYSIAVTARAGGVMRVLADGEASMTTRGAVRDGRSVPISFSSKVISGTATEEVSMLLEDGNVKELVVTPAREGEPAPATVAERRGIIDPLTAMLVPTAGAGEPLAAEACERRLPIFDGFNRYDLTLAFKRMDKISAEKGYAGPVIVCTLSYRPIGGQSDSTPLVKYLSEGREMEIALAPIPGLAMLAPVRFSVASSLASLIITATRFEKTLQSPQAR